MRVTRAAQRVQQEVEELIEAPETSERALKDIEPNTTPAVPIEEALPPKTPAKTPGKKGKGKGKKGVKGKKAKTEEEELAQVVEEAEKQAAASPVEENAEQEPTQEHTDDVAQPPNDEELPKLPQTPSVRLTRRQLAKLEEEALSKSQRAPSSQAAEGDDDNIARAVAEQPVEPFEEKTDVTAGENLTSTAHEESVEAEPEAAPKPARRTRRQKTKCEEEQPEEPVAEAAAEGVADQPETSFEAATVDVEAEPPVTIEQSDKPESEPASKSARLTRRQQAKLEDEKKQAQAEQEKPHIEPNEDEALEEVITEAKAQAEAVTGQDGIITQETAHEETNKLEEIAHAAATETSVVQDSDEMTEAQNESVHVDTEDIVEKPSVEAQAVDSRAPEIVAVEGIPHETVEARPETPTEAEFEADFNMQVDDAVPEEIVPAVEETSAAEPKMLHAEKPFESTTVAPTTTQETIRRTSRSHSKSPMRLEESISAIDRLEEDLESIGTVIPDLGHSEDEKSPERPQSPKEPTAAIASGKTPSKTPAKTPAKSSARNLVKAESRTPGRTPVKAPIPAKAPATARASIAPKPPVVAKAALPTRIARVPNAAPKSVKPTATSLVRASSVRTAPSKDAREPSTETADYLASKRRPISLSFPTPPPPPKGRAPTKPTFQLSSDNVAAKLKAQKEERLKREADGAAPPKQRPISMPPPSRSTKPPTVPSFQLSGEATAAKLRAQKEERLKRMEEAGGAEKPTSRANIMPPPTKSTKQLTKPSFQLPGEATAARLKAQKEERLKRMEEAEAAKKAAAAAPARKPIAHRPRESLLVRDAPGISIVPPPQSDAPQRSTSLASKRSSIAEVSASRSTSTSSANRNSVLLAEGGKSTVSPVDAAALKVKGKQVFNRDRMEKEAMERERRDKEEAAKRARAEAAERGRIASREWAERQKKKLMGQ